MSQYIDKSVLLTEIERIENELHYETFTDEVLGKRWLCNHIKSFLDSLEVKEVVAEQNGTCNGILNTIIGNTWHIKAPLDKAGLKHGDKVKILIAKGE